MSAYDLDPKLGTADFRCVAIIGTGKRVSLKQLDKTGDIWPHRSFMYSFPWKFARVAGFRGKLCRLHIPLSGQANSGSFLTGL
jgi:hypothetical protein